MFELTDLSTTNTARIKVIGIGGLTDIVNSPMYATGVGLVLYGIKHVSRDYKRDGGSLGKWFQGIKKWFIEFF